MDLKIGITRGCFGLTDALALHILRSLKAFDRCQIVLISDEGDAAKCHITLGFGAADIDRCHFSDKLMNSDLTLEKLMGMENYNLKLSCAGQVYAEYGHQFLHQKYRDRYGPELAGMKNSNRDFRKLYEYFIEVIDTWRRGDELEYPMPEKTLLLAFLSDLDDKMNAEPVDEFDEKAYLAFVDNYTKLIGAKFERTYDWYMDAYLPAFDLIVKTLRKTENYGVVFFDHNFENVTVADLLLRAANTLRLPRLMIRPSFKKIRLECVKMVKPILYFPQDWVGRADHVFKTLQIGNVDYISSDRTYAIVQTLDDAFKLAYRLLTEAERSSNLVISQECSRDIGKHEVRRIRSLPSINGDHSSSRKLITSILEGNGEQSQKAQQDDISEELMRKLHVLAGQQTTAAENLAKNSQNNGKPTAASSSFESGGENKENSGPCTSSSMVFKTENDEEQEYRQRSSSAAISNHNNNNIASSGVKQPEQMATTTTTSSQPQRRPETEQNGVMVEKQCKDKVNGISSIDNNLVKLFKTRKTVLGVPAGEGGFTMSHVVGAAIISLAFGTGEKNVKIKSLDTKGCTIKLGPGIYDYDDGDQKFTSQQIASLFSFDLCPPAFGEDRMTVAGIAFAVHGKRALAKVVADGKPEQFAAFMNRQQTGGGGGGRRQFTAIFHRVYRRLVHPIDEWCANNAIDRPSASATREADLLIRVLQAPLAAANAGGLEAKNGLRILTAEERVDTFRAATFVCMKHIQELIRSLMN